MPYRKKRPTKEAKAVARVCMDCADTCVQAIPHFLELEGENLSRPHVSLVNLCSEICRIAARTLLMGYEFHHHICGACAALCDACADDCETVENEFIRRCVEECRRCAKSCRQISEPKGKAASGRKRAA